MIIYTYELTPPFEAPHYKAEIFENGAEFSGVFGSEGGEFKGESFSKVVHKMRLVEPLLPFQKADWQQKHLGETEGD